MWSQVELLSIEAAPPPGEGGGGALGLPDEAAAATAEPGSEP